MEYIYSYENNQQLSSSSGCESGWTLYLGGHSSHASSDQERDLFDGRRTNRVSHDEEEDEDSSMVSDASSGPPHLNEEDSYASTAKDNNGTLCFHRFENIDNESALCGKNLKRQKIEEKRRRSKEDRSSKSLLDDTASSPFFGFSNERFTHIRSRPPSTENESEYSQGYSTTHFEGKVTNQDHEIYDFFQSPASGNQLNQNQWFEGKRW